MPDAPEREPRDDEHVHRLFTAEHMDNGELLITVFKEGGRQRSVFVEQRLPDGDPQRLHVAQFSNHGRLRLSVDSVRSATYETAMAPHPFDVVMDREGATGPLAQFGDAHAVITGPDKATAQRRLLRLAQQEGRIERLPT